MNAVVSFFDPAIRFQRAYAEYLRARFRSVPCPGARYALETTWVEPRGWRAALARHARITITGAPGAGKTTTLAYLAITAARNLLQNPHARVPLFFPARTEPTLPRIYDLPAALHLNDTLAAQAPRIFFANVFATGRALVLIDDADALDPDTVRAALKEYQNATIIATAEHALPDFAEYRLPGWHDHQIAQLAHKLDLPDAPAFVAALKTHNVPRALSAHPLTATLLARLWHGNKTLATNRTDLFDAFARMLLGEANGTLVALEDLGLTMQRERAVTNGLLAQARGLLRATRNRGVEFAHDLWQAYFAARALRRAPDLAPLRPHLTDPAWREVILFYAGLGDATDLILNLQSQGATSLAARAAAHARTLRADLRAAIRQDLQTRAWNGDADALAVLSEMNDPAIADEWATRLNHPDSTIRLRAVEMLGRLQTDRCVDVLLPQLRQSDGALRDKVVEALSHAYTDRVIEPLLVALRGDARLGMTDARLRLAAAQALGEIASEKAVPALLVELQIGESAGRAAAADALKNIHSPLMIETLQSLTQSPEDELRRYAQEILAIANDQN